GEGRDQVARVDDDHVGPGLRDVPSLLDEPVAHSAEVRVGQRAGERGFVGAVARRVDGEVDAAQLAGHECSPPTPDGRRRGTEYTSRARESLGDILRN